EWGLTTSYGNIDTVAEHPVTGTDTAGVSRILTGLESEATYHYRLRVVDKTNGDAVHYGADVSFKTLAQVADNFFIRTIGASNVTSTSAQLHGEVNPDGVSTTVSFDIWIEGDPTAVRTIDVATPFTGDAPQPVSVTADQLQADSTYIFRANAQRAGADFPANEVRFHTPANPNEVVDAQALTDTGTVVFTSTGITMDISEFVPGVDDVFEVGMITAAPDGEIPFDIDLLDIDIIWRIEHFGSGAFALELTFETGAGTISAAAQADPSILRLIRRESDGSGVWAEIATASAATDHSVTFPNIDTFSQFTLGVNKPDLEDPRIQNVAVAPQAPVTIGDPVAINVRATDDLGLDYVVLRYMAGGGSMITKTMIPLTDSTFTDTIPGDEVTITGLLLRIEAFDLAGKSVARPPQTIAVAFGPGEMSTENIAGPYVLGLPSGAWRLFSVPGVLANNRVSANLTELGETGGETWKIFDYTNEVFRENPDRLIPGRGYWVHQLVEERIHVDVGAGQVNGLDHFEIEVEPNWNLIGNPFPFTQVISLDSGDVSGPITYNADGWTDIVPNLQPWVGYAVYNWAETPQTIVLSAVPQGALAKAATEPDGWLLNLSAMGSKFGDRHNRLGRLEGASDYIDKYDLPEPPNIAEYVSLAITKPEWGPGTPNLTADVRSLSEGESVWDLYLTSYGAKGPIEIDATLSGQLDDGLTVVLMDLHTREVYDLTAGEAPEPVTRSNERFPYRLKVMAGSAAFVSAIVKETLDQLPVAYALGQNYPNPFNPKTILKFSLLEPQRASLVVYNLLGEEVVRLVDGWADMGHHEAVWDGRDRHGNMVATGIYFAQFRTAGQTFTRKMLLLK
ncbi:MAG: T9SS type A sorting domain-containing protein, partial [Candidatus Marinimicrobia bacterium]|nr:T9SS type A sorting domain-containing protein [Candidatus Neomarinimicrobiota bacterium]